MFSPYEELEYLSEYLPEEGEAVLITRESGELVCKPWSKHELRDGVEDADLYGFLVQANEQLHSVGAFPLWIAMIGLVWLAILLHGIVGLGWSQWYVVPGISFPLFYACFHWIRHRQHRHFQTRILPQLRRELVRRGIGPYALIAGARQHGELRTLLDELIRWSPEAECPLVSSPPLR